MVALTYWGNYFRLNRLNRRKRESRPWLSRLLEKGIAAHKFDSLSRLPNSGVCRLVRQTRAPILGNWRISRSRAHKWLISRLWHNINNNKNKNRTMHTILEGMIVFLVDQQRGLMRVKRSERISRTSPA